MTDFERLVKAYREVTFPGGAPYEDLSETSKRRRREEIAFVLSALDSIGYQAVPKVPLEGMRDAGARSMPIKIEGLIHRNTQQKLAFDAYTAMLAAAPKLEADNG